MSLLATSMDSQTLSILFEIGQIANISLGLYLPAYEGINEYCILIKSWALTD